MARFLEEKGRSGEVLDFIPNCKTTSCVLSWGSFVGSIAWKIARETRGCGAFVKHGLKYIEEKYHILKV